MDGAEVGVLEHTHQIGLCCFLKRHERGGLESVLFVGIPQLCDLAHKVLEGSPLDQELGRLLEAPDLTQGL